jgi:hypothetical protein
MERVDATIGSWAASPQPVPLLVPCVAGTFSIRKPPLAAALYYDLAVLQRLHAVNLNLRSKLAAAHAEKIELEGETQRDKNEPRQLRQLRKTEKASFLELDRGKAKLDAARSLALENIFKLLKEVELAGAALQDDL